jgi:cytochrome c biogenesis protein CcmG/thiol:disulfide interchange protein DsbE
LSARGVAWTAAAGAAALLVAALAWGLVHPANPTTAAVVGRPAPEIAVRTLVGDGTVRLSELHGRPVVLNFWASWCAPCRQEAPALRSAAQELAPRVAFLGVNFSDSTRAARAFLAQEGYPYPVGTPVDGIPAEYGVTSPPVTFFIDGRGTVVAHFSGPVDRQTIQRYLQLAGYRGATR